MTAVAELRARFLDAQLRGDRRQAARIVLDEGLAAGVPAQTLQQEVIEAAQREIGRLWQENVVTVAEEHMATAIAGVVLTQLFERATAKPRNSRRITVACVEGELHEFPARLVSDSLDLAGFDVRYLGANVPTKDLIDDLTRQPPHLLALSATMSFHAPALRGTIREVRAKLPTLPIAAGGGALTWTPTLADELDVAIAAKSAGDLVVVVERALGVR